MCTDGVRGRADLGQGGGHTWKVLSNMKSGEALHAAQKHVINSYNYLELIDVFILYQIITSPRVGVVRPDGSWAVGGGATGGGCTRKGRLRVHSRQAPQAVQKHMINS